MTATFDAIATTTLSGGNSQITVSGISTAYKHLFCSLNYAGDTNLARIYGRLNNLAGSNYSNKGFRTTSTTINLLPTFDEADFPVSWMGFTGTNPRMSAQFYILNYSATSGASKKGIVWWGNGIAEAASVSSTVRGSTIYSPTNAAITRIDLFMSSGSFNTGTTFTIYGLM